VVTESETALLAEPEAGVDSLADRVLVRRFVIDGDDDAMEEVVSRHWPTALRVARRYTGNESDAEDCVQEALLRACRAAAQYDGRGTVRAWLLQSVVNACRMRFREEDARHRREQVVGDTEWLRRQGAVDGGDLEREEQRELVRAAMAELPERYRVPLWLRYVEDLSPQEVASALELPEATARSQIHRGLKQVGERLRKGGMVLALPLLAGLLGELTAAEATPPLPAGLAAGALPTAGTGLAVGSGGSLGAILAAAVLSAALTVVAGASAGAWTVPMAAAPSTAAGSGGAPPPAVDRSSDPVVLNTTLPCWSTNWNSIRDTSAPSRPACRRIARAASPASRVIAPSSAPAMWSLTDAVVSHAATHCRAPPVTRSWPRVSSTAVRARVTSSLVSVMVPLLRDEHGSGFPPTPWDARTRRAGGSLASRGPPSADEEVRARRRLMTRVSRCAKSHPFR